MAADAGGSAGAGSPASGGMTSKSPLPTDPPPRHYPLDIPLPFQRYEHQLAARDIMVHRIMADFMKPSRVFTETYDSYVAFPADFSTVTSHHADLGNDLRCLQKMLTTSYLGAPSPPWVPLTVLVPSEHAECCGIYHQSLVVEGPRPEPPLLGDQVLDLVRRHYFEKDNAALRAWISSLATFPSQNQITPRLFGYQMRTRDTQPPCFVIRVDERTGDWTRNDTNHLRTLQPKAAMQNRLPLYDGGIFMRYLRRQMGSRAFNGSRRGVKDSRWMTTCPELTFGSTPCWPGEDGSMRFLITCHWNHPAADKVRLRQRPFFRLDMSRNAGRGRNRDGIWSTGQDSSWAEKNKGEGRYGRLRRRCTSEPPPRSFTHAFLGARALPYSYKLVVTFPSMTLSQLDRRSRRRSLSRTRIQEMFDWDVDLASIGVVPDSTQPPIPEANPQLRCENCGSPDHHTSACESPCGYCGAPNPWHRYDHLEMTFKQEDLSYDAALSRSHPASQDRHWEPHVAPQCPVPRHNRCKCLPFPFHVAASCGISCRRDCGKRADAVPGSFHHRNAMLCRSRCCMCGLRGHSGKDCRLKRCRCGGAHLGQDCSWKPECKVRGCGRYWCGLHCRGCGSAEKPFVKWRCIPCAGDDAKVLQEEETRGRPRRRRQQGDQKDAPAQGANGVAEETATPQIVPNVTEPTASVASSPIQVPHAQPSRGEHPQSLFGGPRVPREGPRDK